MRKKTSKTPARRGPGRPRKTTTTKTAAKKTTAKKKTRGRPRKDSLIKATAKRVGRAGKSLATAAKQTLFGTVHGLAKWVPEKGDVLITKTAGAFRLGNSSWRRDKTVPPLETAAVAPVAKRRVGRPRKVREANEQVISIKTGKKGRVSPEVVEAVEELGNKMRQVVQGSSEKKAL